MLAFTIPSYLRYPMGEIDKNAIPDTVRFVLSADFFVSLAASSFHGGKT